MNDVTTGGLSGMFFLRQISELFAHLRTINKIYRPSRVLGTTVHRYESGYPSVALRPEPNGGTQSGDGIFDV
jgi:hypothetical protein